MPYTPPTVNYSATLTGTYTSLTGVVNVNIARGRQYFQDNFPVTTCTVELIPATSYATPLAIGQYLDVRDTNSGTSPCYFTGRITDIQRSYAIPYNSGTGFAPGDRITITATGSTGMLGQTQIVNYSAPSAYVESNLSDIAGQADTKVTGFIDSVVLTSAFTVNSSAYDAANQLLRTGQMVLDDYDMRRTLSLASPNAVFVYKIGRNFGQNYAFADTGAGQRFTGIEYLSSAQTTFNKVQVEPEGLATQTVTGTGNLNTLVYNTYNVSTSDAASLANYLYQLLSGQLTPVPFRITTNTLVAANCMDIVKPANLAAQYCAIGQEVSITFRGSTVKGIIQGFTASFNLEKASVSVTMSPSLGQPFTLDSSAFGVLNTNRLGYP